MRQLGSGIVWQGFDSKCNAITATTTYNYRYTILVMIFLFSVSAGLRDNAASRVSVPVCGNSFLTGTKRDNHAHLQFNGIKVQILNYTQLYSLADNSMIFFFFFGRQIK